jgi:hypothetical protein
MPALHPYHAEKALESVPWHGRYPHLSILILYSTNLPREIQDCIGESIFATLKRYFYFLRSNAFLRKIEVIPAWNFYLSNKQKARWHNASQKLHKAYSLIMILPGPVLSYMDLRSEVLVNFLSIQTLTGDFDLTESRRQINACLNLSNSLLMQLPAIPQDEEESSEEVDAIDILGDELVLAF